MSAILVSSHFSSSGLSAIIFVMFFLTKIDDLLMRHYSLYHRCPRKRRQLKDVGETLKAHKVTRARSEGTRWIDDR